MITIIIDDTVKQALLRAMFTSEDHAKTVCGFLNGLTGKTYPNRGTFSYHRDGDGYRLSAVLGEFAAPKYDKPALRAPSVSQLRHLVKLHGAETVRKVARGVRHGVRIHPNSANDINALVALHGADNVVAGIDDITSENR